jgi:sugar-specific transcriptional regulator TrmB
MNDTPETDYEVNDKSFIYTMGGLPPVVVHVEFARNLERERDRFQEQADALLLRIEEMKCKHENECRKLQAGLGNIICDLQDTVANLRRELNTTKHLSDSWRDGYRAASNERDMWKSEAEHWREISK